MSGFGGNGDWREKKPDNVERALGKLDRILGAWDIFQIAVWTVFLVVFPPLLLVRGLLFGALLTAGLGLFLTYYVFWKPGGLMPARHRRKVCFPLFALHLAVAAGGVVQLARPLSGGFTRVADSKGWAAINGMTQAKGRNFLFLGSGEQSKALVLEANGQGRLVDHLDYPGSFGWVLLFDPASDELIAVPSEVPSLWAYSLSAKQWTEHPRPSGLTQQGAVVNGRVFMVIDNALFVSDAGRSKWDEVREVGRCFAVTASLDPANPTVLVTGARVFESPDAGETWRDISPAPSPFVHAEAAVGGGGYFYVYEGGMFSSHFYVAEPGRPLEARALPHTDTRVIIANPRDGREIWTGSWGGGVHRSRDAGKTFEHVGLDRVEVRSMLVDFDAHKVFVPASNMAFNRGFYWRSFSP